MVVDLPPLMGKQICSTVQGARWSAPKLRTTGPDRFDDFLNGPRPV